MNYHITFWDKNKKPLKINEKEKNELGKVINDMKFVGIKGHLIAVSSISGIEPIKDEKHLALPERVSNPISKERLEELKLKFSKIFL